VKQYIVLEKLTNAMWEGVIVEVDIDPGTYQAVGVYKTMTNAESARDKRELQCCGDNNVTVTPNRRKGA